MRATLVFLLLVFTVAGGRADPASRFVALSDIHFNPMASGITPALAASPAANWAGLLDRAQPGPSGQARYGEDTPWELLRSALDQMQTVEPSPAFLIVTGDLLAHEFQNRFVAATHDTDRAHYARFVENAVAFVLEQIRARFPGRRVFLALGNNDDDCGDFKLTPDGSFLHATLPLVQRLAGAENDPAFVPDWTTGRGYDIRNPAVAGLRMVFLNSVYFSPDYRNECGPPGIPDPGMAALDWLEGRLAMAARAREKVWLLLHVPPGANVYIDLHGGGCPDRLWSMWKPVYTRRFLDLMERYGDTIQASFAGHTHMDEFRLLGRGGANRGFVLNTPAISPIFGQNPGFDVYAVNADGSLSDRETWAVVNLERAGPSVPLAWKREYAFTRLWGLPRLDLPSLERLASAIRDDKQARAKWFSVFRVGNPAIWHVPDGVESLPPGQFRAYDCTIGFIDPGEYQHCYCGAGQP